MQAWILWLILAAALGIAEVLTLTLAFALIAVAALAGALVAMVGLPLPVQAIAFIVTAGAGVGLVRPVALRHIKQPPSLRSGVAALVGKEALVLKEVSKYAGLVRIGGEEWTARPYDGDTVIPEGKTVDVLEIQGVTALVYPRE